MAELNKIVKRYLDANGIQYKYFAECIDTEYTIALKWLNGTRKLNTAKLRKVHDFLHGKYIKSIDQVLQEAEVSE